MILQEWVLQPPRRFAEYYRHDERHGELPQYITAYASSYEVNEWEVSYLSYVLALMTTLLNNYVFTEGQYKRNNLRRYRSIFAAWYEICINTPTRIIYDHRVSESFTDTTSNYT